MPKYEVRTVEWMTHDHSNREHKVRVPMSEIVSTHPSYAEAVSARDDRDAKAWANPEFNPFLYGGETLFFQTTLPAGPFCDYLEDAGLDPSLAGEGASNADWVAWYELGRPGFTDGQLAAVREAMNLVRFAEVVEVPDSAARGYLIQELNWSWNDQPALDADPEGGNFVTVYRSRTKAEARCAELNRERQAQENYLGYREFCTDHRKGAAEPQYYAIAETPFFEVVEVDLDLTGPGGVS